MVQQCAQKLQGTEGDGVPPLFLAETHSMCISSLCTIYAPYAKVANDSLRLRFYPIPDIKATSATMNQA